MTKLYKTKTFTPLRKRNIIKNWDKSKKLPTLYYETFPNLLEKTAIIRNSYKSWVERNVRCLGLAGHGQGALALLPDERLVDVRDDAAPSDGGLDQCVQLLISSDGELKEKQGYSLKVSGLLIVDWN